MLKTFFSKSLAPFLPLLVLYTVLILVFSNAGLEGDEARHLRYATNLTNGTYTDVENPELLNGPGYPMLLAPLVAMNAHLLFLKLLNALFVIIGVVYFYKSVALYGTKKQAIFFAYLIGLYPPLVRYLPLLYSEPMAFMLICGLIYYFCKLIQSEKRNKKHVVITAFFLGLLVLTKIIFLHVIVLGILLLTVLLLLKKRKQVSKTVYVVLIAVIFIVPYLIYAYSLTGKPMYVGTGGGEILYHRSSPYEKETGNWFSKDDILNGQNSDYHPSPVYDNLIELSKNHREFYLALEPLTHIERDSAFKAMAIKNMKAHPVKYFKNTVANTSRLLFHYPFSYRNQNMDTLGYLIPNGFILVLFLLSLIAISFSKRKIPFEIKTLMVFILIYTGGIILADGRGRNFIVVIPFLILLFAYAYTAVIKITLIKK